MIPSHLLRSTAVFIAMLLMASCGRSRPEKRILVLSRADSIAPMALAALRQIGRSEEIAVDTASNPARFMEDSLARYSAVVFLNTSGDSLNHRQQADLERYVQSGGGVVTVNPEPTRTWPWFNQLVSAKETARRKFDGGRAFHIPRGNRPQDFTDNAFLDELRDGIKYAIGRNRMPNYARADTERVPEANRFQQEILVQGSLNEPTEVAITRDGRVFVTERKGALKLYDPKTGQARPIAELKVNHESENGLIGFTLDPNFDQNRWLYLTYSVADTTKHRVSRFTFAGDTIANEKVLLEVPFDEGCCHTGGSMTFDGKGNLLVSFGDNTNPFNAGDYAPIDPTPGRELMDARRSSANTQDLRGKILRITPQPNGSYTIPAGNLFSDPKVGRPEIYTMGHRNPYRISVDRHTGYVYWGEVGPDARADSVLGPRGYDEVNQARSAGNYGWPMFIADNKRYLNYNFTSGWQGGYFTPQRPVNDSPNNTGAKILPPAQPALIYYPYDRSAEFPRVGEGSRNAMAGPVYHYADFAKSDGRLPEYYDGKFLHYDWMRGWVMAATLNEQGDFVKMEPMLEHFTFDHPIDMEMGPDGSLYVLEYGTYWFAKNQTARLSRITFHAGNRPPVAKLAASQTVGAAPLAVKFSAEGSSDYDVGDALTYTWSFENGATAEGLTATRTFSTPGTYTVRLIVRDPSGAATEETTEIRVGNAPPQVQVAIDGNRSFFWGAEPINYRVQVADAEDGVLGRGVDPQSVRINFDYVPEGIVPTASTQGHQVNRTPRGLSLMQASDCMACHGVEQASVGPSFVMVAGRYAGKPSSVPYLVNKIIQGGGGVWGEHNMSAHPNLPREDAEEMVRYVLSLGGSAAALPPSGSLRLDRHKPTEEGAYILNASYTDQARNGIGPLQAQGQVVLRSPLVRAGSITDFRHVGTAPDSTADGKERIVATAYADGAYLHLGRTDLTGVGRVHLGLRSQGHPFTVEFRAGGADGRLLASHSVKAPAKDTWFDVTVPVSAPGEHDLYIVFRSDAEGIGQWNPLLRVDPIRFERGTGR